MTQSDGVPYANSPGDNTGSEIQKGLFQMLLQLAAKSPQLIAHKNRTEKFSSP
jgi:hypothetical protein